MHRYPFKFAAGAFTVAALHFLTLLFLHGPIKAEYWVRELLAVKRAQVSTLASPKIVFLGGSSTLFNVNAGRLSEALHMPVMNFGLHAGLRLERILKEANAATSKGDFVVLPLEQTFYACGGQQWTDWQLRNALAWDRDYFDALPLGTRLQAIFEAGSPYFSLEVAGAWIETKLSPSAVRDRTDALVPERDVFDRYRSNLRRVESFSYAAYNLDAHGTLQNNEGAQYTGEGAEAAKPPFICPDIKSRLRQFVETMKRRNVTVLIAHAPYLIDTTPAPGWRKADLQFREDIADTGARLLGNRDDMFLQRALFFNSDVHLNERGREVYTTQLLDSLSGALAGSPARPSE